MYLYLRRSVYGIHGYTWDKCKREYRRMRDFVR